MCTQCYSEGNEYLLLDVLIDYQKDNKAISLSDQQTIVQGRPVTCKTTAGWQVCCKLKEKQSELKESHSVQTAEFAVTQGIDHEPSFNWWVKHVLKKRDRIIASNRKWQTRYVKKSHKFGIELLKTLEQALALEAKNGNTLWVYSKKWRMSELHLKYYQTGSQYPKVTNLCSAICSISK